MIRSFKNKTGVIVDINTNTMELRSVGEAIDNLIWKKFRLFGTIKTLDDYCNEFLKGGWVEISPVVGSGDLGKSTRKPCDCDMGVIILNGCQCGGA